MDLKKLGLILLFLCANIASAQLKIGENPNNIDSASIVELESTTKAFVLSRVSTSQMQNIVPLHGALIFNTDTQCVHYFDGNQWNNLCNNAVSGSFSFVDNGNGTFTIDYSDGTSFTSSDLTGPMGPAGTNGADGATGPTGANGTNGSDGATGPTGANGTNGADGATGPTGANGTNGADGAAGPTGANGTNGSDGATGADGATGPTGANGTNGADGATGPTGANGTNGADGATGPTGPTGTNGADGVTGPTGANGTNGADGATGPTGANGTNGADGATGPTGANGTNGANGATGPTGANGTNGADGANGTNGSDGATGPTGANGTNGADGETGPTGANGTNGTNGSDGATGPTGANGTNGADGATGPTGANGTNGSDGATGPTGANGTNGADGATGPTGANGTNGADGAAGPTGANGTNGADGATGPTGANGTNGADGATGPIGPTGPQGEKGDDANPSWELIGNSGTNPTTNFIGTSDAQDLVIKSNNNENIRLVQSNGQVLINQAATFNNHPLVIKANGVDVLAFEDNTGTPQWHWNLLSNGLNFVESNVADYRLFLENGGQVGINTSTPSEQLDVNGNVRIRTLGTAANSDDILAADSNGVLQKSKINYGGRWTNSNTSTNLNVNNTVAPIFGTQDYVDDGTNLYQVSGNTLIVRESGRYDIRANLSLLAINSTGSTEARTNTNARISINGTPVGAIAASGYIRYAGNHDHSSIQMNEILQLNANDVITIITYREANSGTVRFSGSGESSFVINKLR